MPTTGAHATTRTGTSSRRTSESPALVITLQAAVPLHIMDVSTWPDERRMTAAAEAASTIGSHGDDLIFGGRRCAAAFNALARGLALLAHLPGGVTFAGEHWCTAPHLGCPTAPSTTRPTSEAEPR